MKCIMELNRVEICIYCFMFCVLSLYFYGFYVFFHAMDYPQCSYDFDCHGCTTCIEGSCIDYRIGQPCYSKLVQNDVSLYFEFYYGISTTLNEMRCRHGMFSARIGNSSRPVRSIRHEEYDVQSLHLSKRSDRCDEAFWVHGIFEKDRIEEPKKKLQMSIKKPIKVWNNFHVNRNEPCDVPCVYTTQKRTDVDAYVYELRGRRNPPNTNKLSIYMQMEGEHYYPIDTTGWSVENSYRWSSPIKKPYFEWIHYKGRNNIQHTPVSTSAINGVSFLARNCHSKNGREKTITELISSGIRVDSMSSCLHNHAKPGGSDDKIEIMRNYKFHAAFENGNVKDYVTEKVYLALAAGTVPIYIGAPNIDDFVPKGSIIRVDAFDSIEELSRHLKECMDNNDKYQQYHTWRYNPINKDFMRKFAFTNVSTECRTCRWVYAKQNNLFWNEAMQHFERDKPSVPKSTDDSNLRLQTMCKRSFEQTFKSVEKDGFVFTGDIHDMWIRDSAAQVNQYLAHLDQPKYRNVVKSVILKQHFFIMQDPYANSYKSEYDHHPSTYDKNLGRGGWVATRNFELDSGAYFFRLVYKYWKATGELINVSEAVSVLIHLYEVEQDHEKESRYRYPELKRHGLGSETAYTGMVWTGFRPSDDPCIYHYHVPDNVFLAVTLRYVKEMCAEWGKSELMMRVENMRSKIITGIQTYGVQDDIYCYEVDGLGNCLKMDDANIPSLLSLPYIDPEGEVYNEKIYEETKTFILSEKNPYYFSGIHSGIGSPHTPSNHIWHLSMIMQAMLDHDMTKVKEIMDTAGSSLHESFHVDDPKHFTRHWFSWADSLFSEGWWCDGYQLKTQDESKHVFETIAKENSWGNQESISGDGSTVEVNRYRVQFLSTFMKLNGITRLYDIPCGDANWQYTIPAVQNGDVLYYGSDVSEAALSLAKEKNKDRNYMHFLNPINLIEEVPRIEEPSVSLFMLKEVIQHVPLESGLKMIKNIKASGVRYLAVTNHARDLFNVNKNKNINFGGFYPNNMFLAPFHFESPLADVNDEIESRENKKHYGNLVIFDLY